MAPASAPIRISINAKRFINHTIDFAVFYTAVSSQRHLLLNANNTRADFFFSSEFEGYMKRG
jgi:hypothetical protein